MNEQRWRSVAVVLAVVLVFLVAIVFVTGGPGGSSTGATPTPTIPGSSPSVIASASNQPSTSPSGLPSGSVVPSPSASASPTPNPNATPTPTASLAQITFTDFRLDAKSDPAGAARTFTFVTDGPTKVTAKLTRRSPQGTSRFCIKVGKSTPLCRDWFSGTLTGTTTAKGQTTFVVTLIGVGIATPRVDLGLIFRAKLPSVTVTNALFDGTDPAYDGYNGLNGRVKIRPDGILAIKADWGHPFNYTYSLVDLAVPASGGVFSGNGIGLNRADTLTAGDTYGFGLVNDDGGFGITPMTLTIGWH